MLKPEAFQLDHAANFSLIEQELPQPSVLAAAFRPPIIHGNIGQFPQQEDVPSSPAIQRMQDQLLPTRQIPDRAKNALSRDNLRSNRMLEVLKYEAIRDQKHKDYIAQKNKKCLDHKNQRQQMPKDSITNRATFFKSGNPSLCASICYCPCYVPCIAAYICCHCQSYHSCSDNAGIIPNIIGWSLNNNS